MIQVIRKKIMKRTAMFSSDSTSYQEIFKDWYNSSSLVHGIEEYSKNVDIDTRAVIFRVVEKSIPTEGLEVLSYPLLSVTDVKSNEYSSLAEDDKNRIAIDNHLKAVEETDKLIHKIFEVNPMERTLEEWSVLMNMYKDGIRASEEKSLLSTSILAENLNTLCLQFLWKKNKRVNVSDSYQSGFRAWQIPYTFSDEEMRCNPAMLFHRLKGNLPLKDGHFNLNVIESEKKVEESKEKMANYQMLSIPTRDLTLFPKGKIAKMGTYKMRQLFLEGAITFIPRQVLACVIRKEISTNKYEACFLISRQKIQQKTVDIAEVSVE
uniref:Uncharacterized protein n=1 Tax=Jakoba libera TaxID=143017 RepID=M4QA04_JAKLI|nr:hypothetical protein L048_p019 [Jakoba libera]AGH24237.1 hypothetical protein [Jakoba libera]